jgi:SAM-dependent methyltransferase
MLGAAAAWPAWAWLLMLLPLLLAYPLRAWRDAPFFPTPAGALQGLADLVGRPARVLDAGCGLGHGLRALRALWPQAELHGVEWSAMLALATRWRCRWAHVAQGDLWAQDWRQFDLVYAFQRPESMARLWAKAQVELRPGSWLVSLEFAVPGAAPHTCLHTPGQRPVWVYRTAQAAGPSTAGPSSR